MIFDENDSVEKFKQKLFEDLRLDESDPKVQRLFYLAWEYGHSSGYREVHNYAMDLADLIK